MGERKQCYYPVVCTIPRYEVKFDRTVSTESVNENVTAVIEHLFRAMWSVVL